MIFCLVEMRSHTSNPSPEVRSLVYITDTHSWEMPMRSHRHPSHSFWS
ncbi:hypothetical protein [Chlorogloeopsis sp. ULAP02]